MNPIDELAELFAGQGAADYLGEPVSQAEHMYQAGLLAQEANATDALIAAALLHDVAVEPQYFAQLSEASVYTVKVQGGPMTPEQIQRFEAEPYYADAVALRRWDDQAKDPTIETPGFEHFRPILERLLTT